jgi:two-component system, OmpR family, manganese sensing response regulator
MARILIVEDNEAVSVVIKMQLEPDTYVIDVVQTGLQALEQLKSGTYDLIILDWMLPDISGIQVCQEFRAGGGSTPVLMLTAKDRIDDKVTGLDAGADDYLVKPFDQMELNARVRALLRNPA